MPDVPDEAPHLPPTEILEREEPDESPAWISRLSHGDRLRRVALTLGSLALALFVVLGGPASTLAFLITTWQQLSYTLFAPRVGPTGPVLNASDWAATGLPTAAFLVRGLDLHPSPADPELGYLCWIGQRAGPGNEGPVNLYASTNGARSWSALPMPGSLATGCSTAPDAVAPDRVVLLLHAGVTDGCDVPALYASADRGARWAAVPLPQVARAMCDLAELGVNGRLYVWSPSAQRQSPTAPAAQLLTSGDGGTTWTSAFSGLRSGYSVTPLAAHADGTVLALVSPPGAAAGAGQSAPRALWCSRPSGAAWKPFIELPAGAEAAFASSDPASSGCDWGRVYAATYQSGGDPSASDAQVARIQMSVGSHWQDVLAMSIAGAVRDLPLGEDGHILGVGPGGLLMVHVLYTGPSIGLANGDASPAHVLWGWDPARRHWLSDGHVEPANSAIEGFSWSHARGSGAPQLVVWVYTLNAGVPGFTGVFRAIISAP